MSLKSEGTHPRKTRTLDVRPMMARGEEPFVKIIQTVASLGASEDLILLTPFLPSPLIEKLGSEGFHARPERRSDGGWQTHFSRE
jgi:hypothetical protein